MLVVFSAVSYRNGTEAKSANDNSRAVLSYVVTAVKDSQDADLSIRDFSGGKGLSIIDDENGYERRIFAENGELLEEYAAPGSDISSKDAMVIGNTDIFEINRIGQDVLKIRTDQGSSYVRIRK